MGNCDKLASILFDGDVVAADFKCMPGPDAAAKRDIVAGAIIASMERVGLTVGGKLTNVLKPKQ